MRDKSLWALHMGHTMDGVPFKKLSGRRHALHGRCTTAEWQVGHCGTTHNTNPQHAFGEHDCTTCTRAPAPALDPPGSRVYQAGSPSGRRTGCTSGGSSAQVSRRHLLHPAKQVEQPQGQVQVQVQVQGQRQVQAPPQLAQQLAPQAEHQHRHHCRHHHYQQIPGTAGATATTSMEKTVADATTTSYILIIIYYY